MGIKREDEPAPVKLLREARKILEPYWEVADKVWAQFPPQLRQMADRIELMEKAYPEQAKQLLYQYPQILQARKMIAMLRRNMKAANPTLERVYRLFYSY